MHHLSANMCLGTGALAAGLYMDNAYALYMGAFLVLTTAGMLFLMAAVKVPALGYTLVSSVAGLALSHTPVLAVVLGVLCEAVSPHSARMGGALCRARASVRP